MKARTPYPFLEDKSKFFTEEDLDKAFSHAKRPDEDTFIPPDFSDEQKKVILQRRWSLVHPDNAIPDSLSDLLCLIPTDMNVDEVKLWLWGCSEEARRRYIIILNTSWSKTELNNRLSKDGLISGLEIFDNETKESLERDIIRALSD